MKQIFTSILAAAIAFGAAAMPDAPKARQAHRIAIPVGALHKARAAAQAPADNVLMEESFAKLTEGSVENPVEITLDDYRNIPDNLVSEYGWGGNLLYQAGGQLFVAGGESEDDFGELWTPSLPDVGGMFSISMDVCLAPGMVSDEFFIGFFEYAGLEALGEDYYDEVQFDYFEIGEEWTNVCLSVECQYNDEDSEAWFEMYTAYYGDVLIKNVVITYEEGEPADDNIIYAGLINSDSDWEIIEDNLPEGLSYVWRWKVYNNKGYLNASAFVSGTPYPATAYATTLVDLREYTNVTFSFDHAAKFQTNCRELCKAVVRVIGDTEWTTLDIPNWPDAGSWTFVNSGEISLADFEGKAVELGLVYGSTAADADTWEVNNFVVKGEKTSAVIAVEGDENAPAVYYNLQGIRVVNPANGIFIAVRGASVAKEIIR